MHHISGTPKSLMRVSKQTPKKRTAITNWPKPVTVADVHSFLGFTNHYWHFIHCYAQIAHPLNFLTAGENANRKKKSVDWTPECDMAFKKLKSLCSSTPILVYADYTKTFTLHTDASKKEFWAALYKK